VIAFRYHLKCTIHFLSLSCMLRFLPIQSFFFRALTTSGAQQDHEAFYCTVFFFSMLHLLIKFQIFVLSAPFSSSLLCTVPRKHVIYMSEIIRGYLTKFELNGRTIICGDNRSVFFCYTCRDITSYTCSDIWLLVHG
jgi:hypothetical protein